MKHSVILFLIFLLAVPAFAQEEGHMQYGLRADLLRIGFNDYDTFNVTGGWRFNRRNYLGIGTGCHVIDVYTDSDPSVDNGPTLSVPLYADYVHYYPLKNDKNSFYLGAEAGMTIYPDKLPTKNDDGRIDPYYSLKLGWDFTLKNSFGIFFGPSLKVYDGINLSLDVGLRF